MSDPNWAPTWADTLPADPVTDSEVDRWIQQWESSAIKTPTGALRLMAGFIALIAVAIGLAVWLR